MDVPRSKSNGYAGDCMTKQVQRASPARQPDRSGPETISFFLVPKFSMMAFTAAVEPLRNRGRCVMHIIFVYVFSTHDIDRAVTVHITGYHPQAALLRVERDALPRRDDRRRGS